MSATPKQVALIEDLFNRKGIPTHIREQTRALYQRADQRPAHEIRTLIDGMFTLPDAPATRPANETVNDLIRRLNVPKSMYAVSLALLTPSLKELAHGNQYLFAQISEFKDTQYVRVLRGAPGSFNREKPTYRDQVDLVNIIATSPQLFAQTFGLVYTCCGSCGAELTDDRSRALKLGPECRKKFGL
jgi:hypothetical protein